jgi:hypothetical protein
VSSVTSSKFHRVDLLYQWHEREQDNGRTRTSNRGPRVVLTELGRVMGSMVAAARGGTAQRGRALSRIGESL